MGERKYLNGNEAVAMSAQLARVEVVAAYPITPQSTVVERIAHLIATGNMDADFIKVESEHSALAVCYGAACAGVRVFTATSSQGLAYMSEVLPYISGCRLPVVMAVANRALAAPWTIWGDHQDSVSQRDSGWIQLYVESAQEALDTCLQAYRIAELPEVLTPVMVCLDGFTLSHTEEPVEVPAQEEVDRFLGSYNPLYTVDTGDPHTFCIGVPPEQFGRYKLAQQQAMDRAREVISAAEKEFAEAFGRAYGGLAEEYRSRDAEVVLVTMGSVAGTAREVVDHLRDGGHRAGLIKVRSFRPFPGTEIAAALAKAAAVGVLDRNVSYGHEGALFTEVKAALYGAGLRLPVQGFIAGLGGEDIRPEDVEEMFASLKSEAGRRPGV